MSVLKDSSITIYEALQNIKNGKYVMPAFQRQYVWSMEQIEKLWDSILLDYPIATFLFWHVNDDNVSWDTYFCNFLSDVTFDSRKQADSVNYSFGANDLSVNEATVRYTIHLNVAVKQLELDYWNQYSAASDVIWAELEQFPDQSVSECDSYYDKIDELRGTYIKHILALYIRYFVDEEMETSDDLLEQYAYKIKNYTMKALYEGVPGYYDRTPTLYEDDSDGDDDDK